MKESHAKKILNLARKHGVLRAKELAAHEIPREYLARLVSQGLLERRARGLYSLPDQPISEHHTLVQVAARIPRGVICLLSALSFHGITTQQPAAVWVAIPRDSKRTRKLEYPPLKLCVYSEGPYQAGIESHKLEGRTVNIYNLPKTIADCFKYRNKIGLDVALEALQDGWRQRRFSMMDIEKYADICRVSRVMRPYLEALTG